MKIFGTGLTGLVGSRFVELLNNTDDFENIDLENGINILDKKAVFDSISSSNASVVIHMAAKTNVDGCELDKKRDQEILGFKDQKEKEKAWVSEGTAWGTNVFGTQNVINACKVSKKKLVYISTDLIFDGKEKSYRENDQPYPINWYGRTKFEGEKLILGSFSDFIIARIAYPYRAVFERNDFVRGLISKLKKGEKVNMITDHIFVPTFIDDIAGALDILIKTEQKGIFHVVGSQAVTPFESAVKITRMFGLDESLISETTRKKFFDGKAERPFCLNLKNDKIARLGIKMSTFDEGLKEVKNQIENKL